MNRVSRAGIRSDGADVVGNAGSASSSTRLAPSSRARTGRLVTSTQFAPSVLYALPDGVTNSMWLRPYLGAGPRVYRANLETRLGYEAFGGAEATLAAMPQVTHSAPTWAIDWSRPSINGFEPRRIGFSLSGHWSVK